MFHRLAKTLGFGGYPPPQNVIVTHGKQSFEIAFEPEDSANEADPARGVTVGFLRSKIAEILTPILTGNSSGTKLINPASISIYHNGSVLDNDKIPLADASIRTGDHLLVEVQGYKTTNDGAKKNKKKKKGKKKGGPAPTSTKSAPAPAPASAPTPAAETKPALTPQQQIKKVLDDVEKDIGPQIRAFIAKPPTKPEEKADKHRRLGEIILQRMLLLDNIDVSGNDTLRKQRKDAINTLHEFHKSLDVAAGSTST